MAADGIKNVANSVDLKVDGTFDETIKVVSSTL